MGTVNSNAPFGYAPDLLREFARITREMTRSEDELRRAREMLEDRTRQLASLQGSLTWRLTAPIRKAADSLHSMLPRAADRASVGRSLTSVTYPEVEFRPGTLAIDVSATAAVRETTGIQRVAKEISAAAESLGAARAFAVDASGAARWWSKDGLLAEPLRKISCERVLVLDGGWGRPDSARPFFTACHREGIEVVVCVFDLIPLDYPEGFPPGFSDVFQRWVDGMAEVADSAVCISRSTAERLREYRSGRAGRRLRRIGWWPLGSLTRKGAVEPLRTERPYVLIVGTIEPRKNHRFVMEAVSRAWREGWFDHDLVIAGRYGWGVPEILDLLPAHPEFGRRLWWLPSVSDDYLKALYGGAAALVLASLAEGFGLPAMEGAEFGLPLVLSDLPVLREQAQPNSLFFDPRDQESFLRALRAGVAQPRQEGCGGGGSWNASATELLRILSEGDYPITLS